MNDLKECPRCERNCLDDEDVFNSISHVGDDVKICSKCGLQQGNVGLNATLDLVEIEIEKRFRKKLGVF